MEPTQNQNTTANSEQTTAPVQPTSPTTPQIQDDTLMGVLCYLGPLVIIPYLTSLDNPFVKFHVKQGIVLFGVEVIIYLLGTMFLFGLYPIIMLLNLGTLVLAIMGIIHVVGKKEVALPLIGQYADKVKI
jgi:uncharacterized membrane protein